MILASEEFAFFGGSKLTVFCRKYYGSYNYARLSSPIPACRIIQYADIFLGDMTNFCTAPTITNIYHSTTVHLVCPVAGATTHDTAKTVIIIVVASVLGMLVIVVIVILVIILCCKIARKKPDRWVYCLLNMMSATFCSSFTYRPTSIATCCVVIFIQHI